MVSIWGLDRRSEHCNSAACMVQAQQWQWSIEEFSCLLSEGGSQEVDCGCRLELLPVMRGSCERRRAFKTSKCCKDSYFKWPVHLNVHLSLSRRAEWYCVSCVSMEVIAMTQL